ncbi:MAG: histone deacetylase [Bacteroidota bacterium]|jgi:acetoin utilization deacetylase AcuC-like enzyme
MLTAAWHSIYAHPLPEGHRFPMLKYELIPEQLVYEGIIQRGQLIEPNMCSTDILELTHDATYLNALKNGTLDASHIRRIGFPWSYELYKRECIIVQGTVESALQALRYGVSLNIAGGTHHAFANRGEGFCLLNDIAVATNYLVHQKLAERILIIDLDVHQGNGTAALFQHTSSVFTFSMHGSHNYPFIKEHSDLDSALPDGMADEAYLAVLNENLNQISSRFQPDFVFYLSGVDVLETDKYGKLKLTPYGCMQRDDMVFNFCKKRQLSVAVAMGGGYSPQIADIVNAHVNTFKSAQKIFFD